MEPSGQTNAANKKINWQGHLSRFGPGLIILWTYAAASLFDPWRFLPFWIQSSALAITLLSAFLVTRLRLKPLGPGAGHHLLTPGTIRKSLVGLLAISVIGIFMAGARWDDRLVNSFIFQLEESPRAVALSLRMIPPSYTGQNSRTILATEDGPFSYFSAEHTIHVPIGSEVEATINSGPRTPVLYNGSTAIAFDRRADGTFFIRRKIFEAGQYEIRVGRHIKIIWRTEIEQDYPPSIGFIGEPSAKGSYSLRLNYFVADDYGIEDVYLELRRVGTPIEDSVRIELPRIVDNNSGVTEETALLDLSSHLWAGSMVIGRLVAEDALGQKTVGERIRFILPERVFSHPVARNLVSIRKSLLLNPGRIKEAARRLEIQVRRPVDFDNDLSVFVWLRSAYWSLTLATDQDVVGDVTRILWQTAVRLEEGIRAAKGEPARDVLDQMMGKN